MEGGRAVADVLFGDIAPAGKLPITFPKSLEQLPPFDDYNMAGRTYRYMTKEPLYPFGFGLSYTTFEYCSLKVTSPAVSPSGFDVEVSVKNTGNVAADEVVQFYISALQSRLPAPISRLIGFQRIHLEPGQATTVNLAVTPEMLMLYDENGRQVFEPGKFRLTAGGCSPGARGQALGAPQPVSLEFQI
jgi:beta-glucosidase